MLRIVQITDLHLSPEGKIDLGLDNRQRFLRVLREARRLRPDLYFLTGDFSMQDPDREAVEWLREQLLTLEVPVHLLPGNHDDPRMLAEVFNLSGAGNGTLDYAFAFHDLDVIVLDSCRGELTPGQLAWLQQQLIRSRLPVLFMHHPPLPTGSRFMDEKHKLRSHQPLLDVLTADNRPIPVFCGHYHAAASVRHKNITVYVAPPTSFFIDPLSEDFQQMPSPPAFQLIEYTEDRFSVLPYYVNQ